MEAGAGRAADVERLWWLRTVAVLLSPGDVFRALRDDSEEAAEARQEPILALVLLAAFSVVLGTTIAGRLLDDPEYDWILVAVWAVVGGAIYALAAYFLVGLLVWVGARLAGSYGGYRHARHVLGFAVAPLALSVIVWPVRIAVYGGDLFRSGGTDDDGGNALFEAVETGFVVWALGLLAFGLRTVNGWSWARALAATALPAAPAALALTRAYGLL